jgi:ATP-dependent DNA helicase RecG
MFFGRSYLARQLTPGRCVVVAGRLETKERGVWRLAAPRLSFDVEGFSPGSVLEPVYAAVPDVPGALFRKVVRHAVDTGLTRLVETHDRALLEAHRLLPLPDAVRELHAATGDRERLERARRRVALLEAEVLLGEVRERRRRRADLRAPAISVDATLDARIRARLPFSLSQEQEACVADLRRDLASELPMARLLQGDVGTGKTLVAAWAMLAAAGAELKSVLLVPTETLAEQHAARLRQWLAGSRLPVLCVTQSATPAERADQRRALRAKAPCIAVGTQALFAAKLAIERLGLLVIDEQHRFGVEQRGRLFSERDGRVPHVLVMSATPIPRTLATALYGDLDLSEIRNPPQPRQAVATELADRAQWPRVRAEIVAEVARGGRVFVVCPRIGAEEVDEDEASDAAPPAPADDAVATWRELSRLVPAVLAHGRQEADERRAAQEAFRDGGAPCLVATTVVEVGIDVPEATLMVVRGAERLGLSSLHQLRGRVGRGERRARCLLLADPAAARLRVLETCSDGFTIAEADLRERGQGELCGRLQHGHTRFRCLDPLQDLDLLRLASGASPAERGSR